MRQFKPSVDTFWEKEADSAEHNLPLKRTRVNLDIDASAIRRARTRQVESRDEYVVITKLSTEPDKKASRVTKGQCLMDFLALAHFAKNDPGCRNKWANSRNRLSLPDQVEQVKEFVTNYGVLDLPAERAWTERLTTTHRHSLIFKDRDGWWDLPNNEIVLVEELCHYWRFAYKLNCLLHLARLFRTNGPIVAGSRYLQNEREKLWCGALGYEHGHPAKTGTILGPVIFSNRKKETNENSEKRPLRDLWQYIWPYHVPQSRWREFRHSIGTDFNEFVRNVELQQIVLQQEFDDLLKPVTVSFGLNIRAGQSIVLQPKTEEDIWLGRLLHGQSEWLTWLNFRREPDSPINSPEPDDNINQRSKRSCSPVLTTILLQLTAAIAGIVEEKTCVYCGQLIEDRKRNRDINVCPKGTDCRRQFDKERQARSRASKRAENT